MNNVNKTLYIPLYGKALVSRKGIILSDKKAEEIWEREQFPLKGKSKSKWLAYYMAMRSVTFDKWLVEKRNALNGCVVLHLGCGLDSRINRVGDNGLPWYDVDFPAVIAERKRYFQETEFYKMLSADISSSLFVDALPTAKRAIVLLEGVSMYLDNTQLQSALKRLNERFEHISLLVDCYTPFAAKMTKIKNPINDVGVTEVFGVQSTQVLERDTGLTFVQAHELTPSYLIDELQGLEKAIFKSLYAGNLSKKLYVLYEYES